MSIDYNNLESLPKNGMSVILGKNHTLRVEGELFEDLYLKYEGRDNKGYNLFSYIDRGLFSIKERGIISFSPNVSRFPVIGKTLEILSADKDSIELCKV